MIIVLLILLNGIFSMSEIALISARRSNLEMLAHRGDRRAREALRLLENPDNFLSTVQIGITLIGILTGLYSGEKFAAGLGAQLSRLGMTAGTAHAVAQVAIVLAVTYLTLIFGELVPKRIGMNAAEKIARVMARPMRVLAKISSPFVWVLSRSTAAVAAMLGIRRTESRVTEAEIRSMIREGAEDGEVQQVEQQIVGRVFSLGDRTVESIMTPRSEMVWLDAAMSAAEVIEIVDRAPHTRYPVGDGSLDKPLGVVHLKELFRHTGDSGFSLRDHIVPAKYFHEGFEVYDVLEQMRGSQCGYGLVCDEFGVIRGMISLKDIFEALVGELPDTQEEPDIIRRDDGSYLIDGQCPFYDFMAALGIEELAADYGYNTVSGLVLDTLDHIPSSGENFIWCGLRIEVVDMDGARIDKLLTTKLSEEDEA